ncbi:sensor histidine kinase [Paenibacillus sp. PL2-23]|uniref:cache domain-containing sensor histidine kinase n=1 Tax=Paenibacillus sp. PL2-23 TaxID=2100729 RepID=UPI0030F7CF37
MKRMSLLKHPRRWSIGTKMFVLLFIVTMLLFSMLAWNNMRISQNALKEQLWTDSYSLLNQSNQLIDSQVSTVQNILFFLTSQKEKMLEGSRDELENILSQYSAANASFAKAMYMVRSDGTVYSSNPLLYEIRGNEMLSTLLLRAKISRIGISWSEPYESPGIGSTVAFVQSILNENGSLLGISVVELDLEALRLRLAPQLSSRSSGFLLLDSSKYVILFHESKMSMPQKRQVYPPQLSTDFINQLQFYHAGSELFDYDGRSYVVIREGSNRLGWEIVMLIDDQTFYHTVNDLFIVFRNTVMAWSVVLLIITFVFSRLFTAPLRLLSAKMNRVNDINLASGFYVNREDEIGQLAASYNTLLARVHSLIEIVKQTEKTKKDYELKMLQSQIGPHFLQNTLLCVSSLARQKRMDEVRETVKSLIGLLSYSFNRGTGDTITLAEEMELLRMYGHIQRIRYGSDLKLDIHIDDSLLEYMVLKLSLQPLVENAIFHGIGPKKELGTIWIRARKQGNSLMIYILDDGVGMDRKQAEAILHKPVDESADTLPSAAFSSIGVWNVHERIKLFFGEHYGLRYYSRKNKGTVVRIRLPIVLNDSK